MTKGASLCLACDGPLFWQTREDSITVRRRQGGYSSQDYEPVVGHFHSHCWQQVGAALAVMRVRAGEKRRSPA